jgi:high-affinity nickel-transport protein
MTWSLCLLGCLQGMRHAVEPDHLAAVSVMMSDAHGARRGGAAAALVGAWWGAGHALALLGMSLLLSALRAEISPALAEAFEGLVALLLLVLGARALLRAADLGASGPVSLHVHGGLRHRHAGPSGHVHLGPFALARWPLFIGAVHGLAGSGALAALVASAMPTSTGRIAYVALFGIGALLGMALLSGLAGWPLARLGRSKRWAGLLGAATGAVSLLTGLAWGGPLVLRLLRP